MPSIGARCHEFRINDREQTAEGYRPRDRPGCGVEHTSPGPTHSPASRRDVRTGVAVWFGLRAAARSAAAVALHALRRRAVRMVAARYRRGTVAEDHVADAVIVMVYSIRRVPPAIRFARSVLPEARRQFGARQRSRARRTYGRQGARVARPRTCRRRGAVRWRMRLR